jgi:hypothetical protein
VREAFRTLGAEGLVELLPNQSVIVRAILGPGALTGSRPPPPIDAEPQLFHEGVTTRVHFPAAALVGHGLRRTHLSRPVDP